MKDLQNSQYRLRKSIGILGLALPILLLVVKKELLSSMSHYYYSSATIFFVGILFAFGLILLTYKGHAINEEKKERWSDDAITTWAAIFIFIAILVPTHCDGSIGNLKFCDEGYLFGHRSGILSAIHLVSAGLFLTFLGIMCVKKFTLSPNQSIGKKRFYKTCGYIIYASLLVILALFGLEKLLEINIDDYIPGYVFILETVAVWSFGIAWLVKGKIKEDIESFRKGREKT